MAVTCIEPLQFHLLNRQFQPLSHWQSKGFIAKKLVFDPPRAEDIASCRKYLAELQSELDIVKEHVNLLYYIAHYKFDNKYAKRYVKKLIITIANEK